MSPTDHVELSLNMAAKHRKQEPPETIADDRILDPKELLERIPLDRSTIWRMVQEGRFPAPIQLTAQRIGWRWSAILRWLSEREADPLKPKTLYNFSAEKQPPAAV